MTYIQYLVLKTITSSSVLAKDSEIVTKLFEDFGSYFKNRVSVLDTEAEVVNLLAEIQRLNNDWAQEQLEISFTCKIIQMAINELLSVFSATAAGIVVLTTDPIDLYGTEIVDATVSSEFIKSPSMEMDRLNKKLNELTMQYNSYRVNSGNSLALQEMLVKSFS